jgi:single-strand DNA-binding protein
MSINKVSLVGRAGMDPEVKYFDSGKQVCKFTLAVNRRTSNKDEPPDWFDLEMWDKTADVAGKYVKKGSLVGITGSLVFDRWQDKNTGDERTKPIIRVEQLDLLGSKQDNQSSSSSSGSYDSDF